MDGITALRVPTGGLAVLQAGLVPLAMEGALGGGEGQVLQHPAKTPAWGTIALCCRYDI